MTPSIQANKRSIRVWPFGDAPKKLKRLSQNGGDEDWLAYIPARYRETWIPWMDAGPFGCSSVDEYEIGNGDVVRIGSHA